LARSSTVSVAAVISVDAVAGQDEDLHCAGILAFLIQLGVHLRSLLISAAKSSACRHDSFPPCVTMRLRTSADAIALTSSALR